jgi:hypothetical protein
MENQNKQNNINIEPFINKINAYVFKFLDKSTTGRLVEKNGDYLTIELKSGSVLVAHVDSLISIWNVRSKSDSKVV